MKRNNCALKAGAFIVQFINWSDQKRPEKRPARCSRAACRISRPISVARRSTSAKAAAGANAPARLASEPCRLPWPNNRMGNPRNSAVRSIDGVGPA